MIFSLHNTASGSNAKIVFQSDSVATAFGEAWDKAKHWEHWQLFVVKHNNLHEFCGNSEGYMTVSRD